MMRRRSEHFPFFLSRTLDAARFGDGRFLSLGQANHVIGFGRPNNSAGLENPDN